MSERGKKGENFGPEITSKNVTDFYEGIRDKKKRGRWPRFSSKGLRKVSPRRPKSILQKEKIQEKSGFTSLGRRIEMDGKAYNV